MAKRHARSLISRSSLQRYPLVILASRDGRDDATMPTMKFNKRCKVNCGALVGAHHRDDCAVAQDYCPSYGYILHLNITQEYATFLGFYCRRGSLPAMAQYHRRQSREHNYLDLI